MAILKDLIKVQLGKETTYGTKVAATRMLGIVTEFKFDNGKTTKAYKSLGSRAGATHVALNSMKPKFTIKFIVTWEELPYFLQGMYGVATPTGVGPYVRKYFAPKSDDELVSHTIEYVNGTNINYAILGATFSKMSVKWASGDALECTIEGIAKTQVECTMTSLTQTEVTPISANDVKIFMDEITEAIGTTEIENTWMGTEIKLDLSREGRQYCGSVNPSAVISKGDVKEDIDIDLELNDSTMDLFADMMSSSVPVKLIRFSFENGTNKLVIDASIYVPNSAELPNEKDGVVMVNIKGATIENVNTGLDDRLSIELTNSVATL